MTWEVLEKAWTAPAAKILPCFVSAITMPREGYSRDFDFHIQFVASYEFDDPLSHRFKSHRCLVAMVTFN